jgi:hypothetical protein
MSICVHDQLDQSDPFIDNEYNRNAYVHRVEHAITPARDEVLLVRLRDRHE